MSGHIKTITHEEFDKIITWLTNIPLKRMTAYEKYRNLAAFVILYETGLRNSELIQLTINDVLQLNQPVNWLHVRKEIAKGLKPRDIPLSLPVRKCITETNSRLWLKLQYKPSDFCFNLVNHSKPPSSRWLQRLVGGAGREALGRHITPHTLRHSFATNASRRGNIRAVQQLLGHANLATTQIYTHPNSKDLTDAIG